MTAQSSQSITTRITNLIDKARNAAGKASFVGPTLARLTVGLVFVGTGWGKLHSLDDVTQFFASLHIPMPALQARIASGVEFFGGLMLLAGLFTRVACIPLAFTMVVAILTAKRDELGGLTDLVGFEEWSYIVFFVWIALAGPGPLSLDALFKKLRARIAGASAPLRPQG